MWRSAQDYDFAARWGCKDQRLLGFLLSAKQVRAYGSGLAQVWGRKMITAQERCVRDDQGRTPSRSCFRLRWLKSSKQHMGKISTAEVLRLRATSAVSRDK